MVSNARLDLPEPDSPVNTIIASRGRSSETSFRLCSRAPRTTRRSCNLRSVSPGSDQTWRASLKQDGQPPQVSARDWSATDIKEQKLQQGERREDSQGRRAMLAIRVHEFGGPEVLQVEEVDIPRPGPDELLVRVMAAGVGPWDVHLRQGSYTGPLPYIPGGEFAGLVEGETGASSAFHDGEPVYGYPGLTGCYAQYVTCPVEQLAPIPAGLSLVEAAATPIDGLTAEQGLTDELNVGAGDRLLITAGAGGLGHFAVQIARALGAFVVATASPQHHEFVHKLGAAAVVDHTKPDWPERVRDVIDGG